MDTTAWITAVSGLIGAVIGAGAALVGQFVQARSQSRAETATEHKQAIEDVLVTAQAVDLRAHESMLIATNAGSLGGMASRMLRTTTPVDLHELLRGISNEADTLQRAAARVWLLGDEDTVRLTNAVVLAATDVVSAHHAVTTRRIWNYVHVGLTGRHAKNETRLAEARNRLASARKALVEHSRLILGLHQMDPFSVADPHLGPSAQ